MQELKVGQILVRWDIIIESISEQRFPKYKLDQEFIQPFVKIVGLNPQTDPTKKMICVRLELDKSKIIVKQLETKTLVNKLKEILPQGTEIIFSPICKTNDVIVRIYLTHNDQTKSKEAIATLVDKIEHATIKGIPDITGLQIID
jgi:DNA-directed RNA polymerase subunit L